ncbi:protein I'm not dead yet-like [Venturia canescens]|uniref:protein I'm not dead yet-like n=1 Tax=Venturia canescens TaxID=32260 RepID=UPI001C9C164D|nr:protein I'm not dead yet-like [Venturia canescens]
MSRIVNSSVVKIFSTSISIACTCPNGNGLSTIADLIILKEVRCAYVILVMAIYWITECIPLPITSLIPVALFPCLGVLSTEQVCVCYMNDTIMVFVGGFILAIAIEHSNLHMRIALRTMTIVGCSHRKLLAGLCIVTTFLSMWISNTAAAAMMIPIIVAILDELQKQGLCKMFIQGDNPDPEDPTKVMKPTNITKAYLLGTAYCSTFGGAGTLVGTGTNLTFKGIYEATFPRAKAISFAQWMIWATPQMFVNVFLTWLHLLSFYMGLFRPRSEDAKAAKIGRQGEIIANRIILEKYRNLGPMSFQEIWISILFVTCILLWFFKAPGFVTGWAEIISDVEIRDSTPVVLIVVVMFVIPKELVCKYAFYRKTNKRPTHAGQGLVTWKIVTTKMPWSLMFLLGGGFAIAKGSNYSCLSQRIGNAFTPLKDFPPIVILVVVCLFIGTITEVTTNAGVANIMLPVIAQMSVAIEQHPLYLMLPATLCCSFAFRLPVGTPPNAIVAVTGNLSIKSLVIGGCFPAVYSMLVIFIMFPTWGVYVYDIGEFPEWAKTTINETSQEPYCQ